jgi:hypothetical protein
MPLNAFDHTLIGACENIRREAEDLAGSNYARNLGRINGALDMITSPDNGGVETQLISEPGSNGTKLAQLKVLYDQRARPCQASTSLTTNVCNDTGVSVTRKQFIKSIGKKISSPVYQFTNDELVIICKGSREYIQGWLLNGVRATKERWNEVLLAEMNAMLGKKYRHDGSEAAAGVYTDLQLLFSSNGQYLPQPGNYIQIEQDFKNMQLTGAPAIIGAGNFDTFMRLHGMSCCNTATPYGEAILQAGVAYFYDHAANDILGANRLLVLPFGIVHMLTFNQNKNIEEVFGKGDLGTEIHITVPDPDGLSIFTNGKTHPIMWNFDMKWDCTALRWKYMFSLHWDIFNIYQSDSFATDTGTPDCTDDLVGMTGVFGYRATAG